LTFTEAAAAKLALSTPFSITGEAMVVTAVYAGLTLNDSLQFYESATSPIATARSVYP